MWPPRMPLFVDGAVDLAPVHPGRGSLQECSFEDDHLIFGMTDLEVGVVFRNRLTAGQPVQQFPIILGLHDRPSHGLSASTGPASTDLIFPTLPSNDPLGHLK